MTIFVNVRYCVRTYLLFATAPVSTVIMRSFTDQAATKTSKHKVHHAGLVYCCRFICHCIGSAPCLHKRVHLVWDVYDGAPKDIRLSFYTMANKKERERPRDKTYCIGLVSPALQKKACERKSQEFYPIRRIGQEQCWGKPLPK